MHTITEEIRYRLLKYLADHPDATQRELARELGISLGKANYCLQALMAKGWIKAQNFRKSPRKSAYAYILTPQGIEEKVELTYAFLRRKIAEFDLLRDEIERLSSEVSSIEGAKQ